MSEAKNDGNSLPYKLCEPMLFGEKFELSDEQIKRLDEWIIGVEQRAAAIQYESIKANGWPGNSPPSCLPNYGPIGGSLTYTFTPTGIGMACKVTEAITGESIDLTDYDNW